MSCQSAAYPWISGWIIILKLFTVLNHKTKTKNKSTSYV